MKKIAAYTIIFAFLFTSTVAALGWSIRKKKQTCSENIRLIEKYKNMFSAEYGAGMGNEISFSVLDSLSGGQLQGLRCPSGGEYRVNPVGEHVTCTLHSRIETKEVEKADLWEGK